MALGLPHEKMDVQGPYPFIAMPLKDMAILIRNMVMNPCWGGHGSHGQVVLGTLPAA